MDEKSIFLQAVDIADPKDRNHWLDEICRDDAELRKRIDGLLERHSEASSFLEKPPSELQATMLVDSQTGAPNGPPSVLRTFDQELEVPRVTLKPLGDVDSSTADSSGEPSERDAESRYRMLGEIARGGMGAIIKGRDVDLGRDLAIKVLLDSHKDKPELVGRFVEEAQIGGQLQHPGIAPVYELGQLGDERPFFSMKLVKGTTLAAQLSERSDPSTDRPRLLGVFEQICQTMAYAHSRGVVHRDLKPANVMVGAFGEVQVMDWGLAKVLREGGVADEKRALQTQTQTSVIQTIRSLGSDLPTGIGSGSDGSKTQMGSVLGTPAYMPPEQALGEIDRLDERSDVFGLGAILCEILTGVPPYVGSDATEVFRLASRGKLDACFDRLRESDIDEELVSLVRDCLELEPEDRPRNAGVLANRLSDYLESVETRLRQAELDRIEADIKAEEERKRRRVMMALAGSVLLTICAGGGGWIWLKQKENAIQRAAFEQQQNLQQQILNEIASARALANLDSDELPNRQAVNRAVAATQRARKLLDSGEVNESLRQETLQLSTRLTSFQADFDLVADLQQAAQEEMEVRRARAIRGKGVPEDDDTSDDAMATHVAETPRSDLPQLAEALETATFYQQAFEKWGLHLDSAFDARDDAQNRIDSPETTPRRLQRAGPMASTTTVADDHRAVERGGLDRARSAFG